MIHDIFTDLPITRQRRWQLRNLAAGRCVLCTNPKLPERTLCAEHMARQVAHYKQKREAVAGSPSARRAATGTYVDLRPGAEDV